MREILFRGKAINRDRYESFRTNYKNGDWVYGLLSREFDARFENLPAEMTNEDGVSGIDIDYKTIGQSTGLTDKNGKTIFEGDILAIKFYPRYVERVSWDGKPDAIAKVLWDFNAFRLRAKNDADIRYADFIDICFKETEVIGNIYDNPELLDGEEE